MLTACDLIVRGELGSIGRLYLVVRYVQSPRSSTKARHPHKTELNKDGTGDV